MTPRVVKEIEAAINRGTREAYLDGVMWTLGVLEKEGFGIAADLVRRRLGHIPKDE